MNKRRNNNSPLFLIVLVTFVLASVFSISPADLAHSKTYHSPIQSVVNAIPESMNKGFPEGNLPPDQPVLAEPANLSTGLPTGLTLAVDVSDPESQALTITFYGRRKLSPSDDFTVVGLPDTQYYTGELNGGSPDIFYSQTQWVTDNKEAENIAFISQLGDCVENGDQVEDEWKTADTAMKKIEDPLTTYLVDGIPYGIAVGNHDQSPAGSAEGTTAFYNAYFGESRFLGRAYYGGHFGTNNDNHYQFFSAGGMNFIVLHLEYDPNANTDVLDWADELLQTYSNHRAIIVSHFLIIYGNPGIFGPQGLAIYNKFKDNDNVFLMLGGHVPGEGRRTDSYSGNTIHTVLADYQNREFGGSGWLRLLKFSPLANTISIKTYSPWLDEWETDANSEFTLDYDMSGAGFKQIGFQEDIPSGTTASIEWSDLDPNTEYEWYAVVDDGSFQVTGPVWSFGTGDHRLDLKVYLEGPFNTGLMNNEINEAIPLNQPYSSSPWNYPGLESIPFIPADCVDWVLVELRDSEDAASADGGTFITQFAALLKTNGDIVSAYDEGFPGFSQGLEHKLFVVIRHRNHLGIMSAFPLENEAGIFSHDFTTGPEKVYGGETGYKQLSSLAWGMVAGDGNSDGIIGMDDKIIWLSKTGQAGYFPGDLNLNKETDNPDKNDFWLFNLGAESQVPE